MGSTHEWDQMMLTQTSKLYIFHQYKLVILRDEFACQFGRRIDIDAIEQLLVHTGNSGWRIQQAFAAWVFANGFQDHGHSLSNFVLVDFLEHALISLAWLRKRCCLSGSGLRVGGKAHRFHNFPCHSGCLTMVMPLRLC